MNPSAIARYASRRIRGLPGRPPVFGGATLGPKEAQEAHRLLGQPESWADPAPLRAFEAEFAAWTGARHAYTFLGGRVALGAALEALGLRPGDEVLMPGYTCIVVPNAIRFAGCRPVFADIETETYGMDLQTARQKAGPRTRAVLVHHLYGLVARDYAETVEWARDRGLAVIEDCAQSSGARLDGRPVGSRADVAFHSLELSKVLTTVMGGVATTDDAALAEQIAEAQRQAPEADSATVARLLRNVVLHEAKAHGPPWRRRQAADAHGAQAWVSTTAEETRGEKPTGYGRRLPAALARIGLLQLGRVDRLNAERRRRAGRWDAWAAAREGFKRPAVVAGSVPVFLRYPLLVPPERKADLAWARRQLGVQPGVWFKGEHHPVRADLPDCPNARRAVEGCINLPTLG